MNLNCIILRDRGRLLSSFSEGPRSSSKSINKSQWGIRRTSIQKWVLKKKIASYTPENTVNFIIVKLLYKKTKVINCMRILQKKMLF